MSDKLKSRKFWMAIAGVILAIVLKQGFNIPDFVVNWVLGLIGGYIGVEGFVDACGKLKK